MKPKIVLAYSGGLDTSVLVRILGEDYGYDVVACHVDVGEARDQKFVETKAKQAGAVAVEFVHAQDEFAREYCFPALQANALYENVYPLSAALSRPLIAKHLVAAARKHNAVAVAHGSTGKGNDQVRFDFATKGLAPDLKIVAPQRERNMTRDFAMQYAAKHGIEVPTTLKSPYSVDENLWGRSIEGGILEDPAQAPPEDAFAWTKSWQDSPSEPVVVRVDFEAGIPVAVNGEKLGPAALIKKMSKLAGDHGVGRIDLMENRFIGIKSRENYECPAAIALITAHRDLERFTTLGISLKLKNTLDQKYAELIYEGYWFSPYRASLQAFNDVHDAHTTGQVTLRLFKGACQVIGRSSPYGIYNHAMSTYGAEDKFDHTSAEGLIKLMGLQLYEYSRLHAAKGP
jgi:argininosuccinate synthase